MNYKYVSLLLAGILLGCAGKAAHTAHAGEPGYQRSSQFRCLGASSTTGGIEEDLNALVAQGFEPTFMSNGVVCGKR